MSLTWRLVRATELAEGRLALLPPGWPRYALLALWCLMLGTWLALLSFARRLRSGTTTDRSVGKSHTSWSPSSGLIRAHNTNPFHRRRT